MATLAFDIYGTLINTDGIVSQLTEVVGSKAEEFSQTWRNKQLEYSFRRGLMRRYENFSVCTCDALKYTCGHHCVSLTQEQKNMLLTGYHNLPAFDDVKESLETLREDGHQLYAFSNGSAKAVKTLLVANELQDFFRKVVSCDEVKTFKPNPKVYQYFLEESNSPKDPWLISSNPFDVIGAISAGMKAAWIKRSSNTIFDPWGIEPTATVSTLSKLHELLRSAPEEAD